MIGALLQLAHDTERRLPAMGLIIAAGAIFLASMVGVISDQGHDKKASVSSPSTTAVFAGSTTTTTSAVLAKRTPIEGFQTASFNITQPVGPPVSYCGLLASTNDQLAKGLMNQQDLHGYDGMIFAFGSDSTASFYMANVPVPLSVAWFDGTGNLVSSADMAVCTVAAAQCPLYKAGGPYRFAVETLQGGLSTLHVGTGTSLSVGAAGSCT